MSRIDDMIGQMCPDGVESRTLGELTTMMSGAPFESSRFNDAGIGLPLIRIRDVNSGPSGTYYDGDYDERFLIEDGDLLVGMDGDFHAIEWSRGPALLNQRVARIVELPGLEHRYLFHSLESVLRAIQESTGGSTVAHLSLKQLRNASIPVPPIEIQREIVEILDQFTELEAELEVELEAELEARNRQFETYRSTLLAGPLRGAPLRSLASLGSIVTGKTPSGKIEGAWSDEGVAFVTPSDIRTGDSVIRSVGRRLSVSGVESIGRALLPLGTVLVTCIGADMGKAVEVSEPCLTNQQINAVIPGAELDSRYLVHLLGDRRAYLQWLAGRGGGTMPLINKRDFGAIEIPVPDLAVQRSLAAPLDKMQTISVDLGGGLPAEIAARRQQYEYYRDKLLTFPERKMTA